MALMVRPYSLYQAVYSGITCNKRLEEDVAKHGHNSDNDKDYVEKKQSHSAHCEAILYGNQRREANHEGKDQWQTSNRH
jgi:hypothetical protein